MDKLAAPTLTVDPETAARLEKRADEIGMTPAQLVAALVRNEDDGEPADQSMIDDLDRHWAEIEAGGETFSHEEVTRWLKTWGTPSFKPWSKSR